MTTLINSEVFYSFDLIVTIVSTLDILIMCEKYHLCKFYKHLLFLKDKLRREEKCDY